MKNELIVGLAKGIKGAIVKKASAEIEAGTYDIDELIRVQGTVRKAKDAEQIVHMKCDTWNILAVALSKLNGVTVESIVREAVGLDDDAVTAIKEQAKEALDKIKAPFTTMTSGKVTTKLQFSVVGSEQEKEKVEEKEAELV